MAITNFNQYTLIQCTIQVNYFHIIYHPTAIQFVDKLITIHSLSNKNLLKKFVMRERHYKQFDQTIVALSFYVLCVSSNKMG